MDDMNAVHASRPPLDSRQLRAFATLARAGSFTLAAKELFLTQSAVSHSMRALEESVGCRLLDRLGKKVAMTQAGEQLLVHAEKILGEMDRAREGLEHLGKWGHARLRLGSSATMSHYLLPPVLREFKRQFPDCRIVIEPGDTLEVLPMVEDGRIDLALALELRHNQAVEVVPLFSDDLRFLVSPEHPWAQTGRVKQEEIARQNYILYEKASLTFRMIQEFFREDDIILNTVIEMGSMGAIKELVKLGLGVSILAPWIAENELREGSLVALPLGRRKLRRNWGIVHRQGRRLSLMEATFLELCRSETASWGKRFESGTESAGQA